MHVTHTRQSRHGWHDILALHVGKYTIPTIAINNVKAFLVLAVQTVTICVAQTLITTLLLTQNMQHIKITCRLTFVETL